MAHKPNFSAQLTNKESIYDVAKRLGFTQTRGAGKGQGSPREMLEAIGAGQALVINLADDMEYDLAPELRRLAQASQLTIPDGAWRERTLALADLLTRIADGIDLAGELNE